MVALGFAIGRRVLRPLAHRAPMMLLMASLGLSAILGPSDAAKTLTAAIARFAAQPRALTVQATAKSGSGLGLADVLTITEPTQIFDKIDLKATAE